MDFFVIAAIIAVTLVLTYSLLYSQKCHLAQLKHEIIGDEHSGKSLSHSAQLMLGTKSRPQYFLGEVGKIAQKDFEDIELERSLLGPRNYSSLEEGDHFNEAIPVDEPEFSEVSS